MFTEQGTTNLLIYLTVLMVLLTLYMIWFFRQD